MFFEDDIFDSVQALESDFLLFASLSVLKIHVQYPMTLFWTEWLLLAFVMEIYTRWTASLPVL